MKNRDEFLQMDDSALSALVQFDFFKGSGNGGQKRNKTASAVRARIPEWNIAATDCSERSQHRNRAHALRKLRLALAYQCRETPALPPIRTECGVGHPDYPLFLAHLLDLLAEAQFDHKAAAEKWGVSPTALVKKLFADPELWQFVQNARREAGLNALHV